MGCILRQRYAQQIRHLLPEIAISKAVDEMVKHGETALLVSPRKTELMASAIDLLLSNTNLAASLARQARALVESSYSPEYRATRLLKIYTEVYQAATQQMFVQ